MDAAFLIPTLLVLIVSGALGWAEWRAYQRRIHGWQVLHLRFPRDLTSETVEAVLGVISGLPSGHVVALEVQADQNGIEHRLGSDQATIDTLRAQLRALLPGLDLESVMNAPPIPEWSRGLVVRRKPAASALRTDGAADCAGGLLGALQPLGKDERIVLRWLLTPGRAETIPDASETPAGERPPAGQRITSEHRRLLRLKNAGPILKARGLLAVQAVGPGRQRHLLSRLSAVLRTRGTAYGHLRLRLRRGSGLRRAVQSRMLLIGDRYAPAELSGLLAWPIDGPGVPGLSLGTAPRLMPSPQLPTRGRIIGQSNWHGAKRAIAQPIIGGLSHTLISGPTGTGKSVLLTNLICSDIAAGRGTVLIDGKGDTFDAVLARIPEDRHADVIVVDCARSGPLPGLKLFTGDAPQLTADVVLGVLQDLFRDSWGPLSERYLRAALVAVAHDPGGTLADLPYVYSDAAYRRKLVARLHDPLVEATFAGFEAMKPAEQVHQLSASLNKLGIILGRPTVRAFLGQPQASLDFRRVLSGRAIVLINLNPSRIGAPAARLMGALTVYSLFQATLGRSGLPESRRRPFFVYLDEPKALGDLPMPLDSLLEQARGLGVGLTLAPQSVSQLPAAVREAVLTNVATRIIFRSNADDARLLARDLPGIEAEQLSDLGQYQAIARIGLGPGDIAPPVSLTTAPPTKAIGEGRTLAAEAAARHGIQPADVDAALKERHESKGPSRPVGRSRRPVS